MGFKYLIYHSIPQFEVLEGIQKLHNCIFNTSEDLNIKMANKPQLLVIVAMDDDKVIGYKIGYELNSSTFYSWLGGVDPNYRKHGIATELMEKQHHYLQESGYHTVQTKTMNKWRSMLVLNIKNGFDVVETYKDENGLHKIVLEKSLLN